jgi:hypothetical protein
MTTSPATVWLNNGRIALFKEILVSHNLDVVEDKLLAFDDWLGYLMFHLLNHQALYH